MDLIAKGQLSSELRAQIAFGPDLLWEGVLVPHPISVLLQPLLSNYWVGVFGIGSS